MNTSNIIIRTTAILSAALTLAACASSSTVTNEPADSKQYNNFVVIGIAGDYNTRAQFERMVVSELRHAGASATAYYTVVGGNKAVTKADVLAATEEHGFDSVLAIRRLSSDTEMKVSRSRTDVDATPIGGRIVNLFRSDYTDYTTPGSIDLISQATLAIELYDAGTQEIVYSFDHQTGKESNLGLLIDDAAAAIVRRIEREKLIGNQGG